jgi:glutamyl-tRNA reductase
LDHHNPTHIALVGSSHKVAAVHVRDTLFPRQARIEQFFEAVRRGELGVDAGIALVTCSRAEFYVLSDDPEAASARLQDWFLNGASELASHTYVKTRDDAVAHLHRVAAGLDSIMLGEHEILGQMKDALKVSTEIGTAGPVLDRLFQGAIKGGRRARQETAIGRGGTSVAFAASDLANKKFGEGERGTVVILGAGQTAALAAHHFHKTGWDRILIVNRTLARAEQLARTHGGEALPLDELASALAEADALVTAVSSDEPVVDAEVLALDVRAGGRTLLALDLGNPRNMDPAVRDLPHVELRDMDDLRGVSEANRKSRALEIPAATVIAEIEADRFTAWLAHRAVVPLVKQLRESFSGIAQKELNKHARQFGEEDREALERYTQALLNKLLHVPITHLKEMAEVAPGHGEQISVVAEIFASAGWGPTQETDA